MNSPGRAVKSPDEPRPRRISRQREAGAVTRRETRRRVLAAATEEFAERGYAAATVIRIAARADVAVQTLYSAWGSKRALLRAVMETAVTGTDAGFEYGDDPVAALRAAIPADIASDPVRYLAFVAKQFRTLAERAATGWQTYRDAAAVDADIAADWQQLQEIRRQSFLSLVSAIPASRLRPDLTYREAADTAWVIASPESYDLLVRRAGLALDDLERWVSTTLTAALLR